MSLITKLREAFRVLGEVPHILSAMRLKLPSKEDRISLGRMFEETVERYPDNTMLLFEGGEWSYSEVNVKVNRLAHFFDARDIKRRDCVAVLMENRLESIMVILALAKLGATASLINNTLSGGALVHCLKETHTTRCIVGSERTEVLAQVLDHLPLNREGSFFWISDLDECPCPEWAEDVISALAEMPTGNLAVTKEITAGEVSSYIFTSGTTGLPKASPQLHKNPVLAGRIIGKLGFRAQPSDRLYLCLPIYHSTGLSGCYAFIAHGGSIFLRRSFSVSSFWSEVQQYQTNCFMYVGELCRYLVNQPVSNAEKNNPLTKMMGNGLRPDIWDEFKNRFGLQRICEIYGASEGNVMFLNLLNKNKTIGAASQSIALVHYDTQHDEIVRDDNGRCIEVPVGEPGLLLSEITARTEFAGYTNAEATAKKIVKNVSKEGDRWFNTGDLVRQIDVGFALGLRHFQFVDRTGDTFRWRAENVSTNEVAEVVNTHPQINMANVYGVEVPGVEGKAGMLAFELQESEELDLDSFQVLVERALPSYAQPVFVRILRSVTTTATFKLQKADLRDQAFHPEKTDGDLVYVRKPRSSVYELLDPDFYQQISTQSAGY